MNGDTRSYRYRHSAGRRSTRPRTGVTLLEVIVATALLATGGLITVASVTESLAAAERVRQRESELREASRFMEAVALWTRSDLDLRLGVRAQGSWRLSITRLSPSLYEIALLDSLGERELLDGALFRPEPSDDR